MLILIGLVTVPQNSDSFLVSLSLFLIGERTQGLILCYIPCEGWAQTWNPPVRVISTYHHTSSSKMARSFFGGGTADMFVFWCKRDKKRKQKRRGLHCRHRRTTSVPSGRNKEKVLLFGFDRGWSWRSGQNDVWTADWRSSGTPWKAGGLIWVLQKIVEGSAEGRRGPAPG